MSFERLPPLALVAPEGLAESEPLAPAAKSSLELLQAVYSDPCQPMHRRMRAAIAALPFEHPKLAVIATLNGNLGFAAKLEAARARSQLIEGSLAQPADSCVTDAEGSGDVG